MKKILSIDFDIIMSPCIQLYNNYSTDDWEALCSHFEILKFAKPDYIHFKRLLQLLLKLSKNMKKENIHFIASHEMIATYIDKNIDDTISLINIDHHHDIAYTDKDIENKIEDLNCGNWVKYLSEEGKLEWIDIEDLPNIKQFEQNEKFTPYLFKDELFEGKFLLGDSCKVLNYKISKM